MSLCDLQWLRSHTSLNNNLRPHTVSISIHLHKNRFINECTWKKEAKISQLRTELLKDGVFMSCRRTYVLKSYTSVREKKHQWLLSEYMFYLQLFDDPERHDLKPRFLLFILLFFFLLFLGGKRKGEKKTQSRDFKSCL